MTNRFLSALVLLLLACSFVHAGPASPDPVELLQPDGSIIKTRIRGDEFQSWIETVETGHTIVRNPASGYWEYAEQTREGLLKGNGIHVLPNGQNAPATTPKGIKPPRDNALEKSMKLGLQETYKQRLDSAAAAVPPGLEAAPGDWVPTPISGNRKTLIILINFSDRILTTTATGWNNTIFKTTGGALSVANFYKDNSFAALTLTPVPHNQPGNPDGIITVSIAAPHPNSGSNFNYASETNILNLALAQAANYITFANYDTNNNGILEQSELMTYFIYAGYERSGTALTPNIWAHAWGGSVAAGSKTINRWAINGELNSNSDQHPVGVMVHELGHALCGLPDLYDTSSYNEAMGDFSTMAGGGWGRDTGQYSGTTPTNLDAWSREFLGWSTPLVPTVSGTLSLDHALASTSSAYKLVNPILSTTEYFLVENRQPSGWDNGLRGSFGSGWTGGLLITHIDNTAGTMINGDINNYTANAVTPGHQGVVPVQASTVGCNMLTSLGCRGVPTTLFYSGNNAAWTPLSTPSSNYYNGNTSLFNLTSISTPSSTMTANLYIDPPIMRTLTITKSGTGSGTVTSTPAGIACGSSCSGTFQNNSVVLLSAAPATGSLFAGWTGGSCSGGGDCQLTITGDTTINASFAPSITLWSQNFDSASPTALPAGWQSIIIADYGANTPAWITAASTGHPAGIVPHSGSNLAMFNSSIVPYTDSAALVSPQFTLSSVTNSKVKFWMYRDDGFDGYDDRVLVHVNTVANLSGASLVGTVYRSLSRDPVTAATGWYEYIFDIPASYNGPANYLIFQGISGWGNDIHLDDISVAGTSSAAVPGPPVNVTATAGNTMATVSFSAPVSDGGLPVIDYTATSSPGGLTATGTASPLTVSGLSNGTDYTFTVTARNVIGSGTSSTASGIVRPSNTLSSTLWSQNFEAITPAALPEGWQTTIITKTGNDPKWLTNVSTRHPAGIAAHGGSNLVLFNSYDAAAGDSAVLVSPPFPLSGVTNGKLKFWMYRDDGFNGYNDYILVHVNTVANLSGATLLGTVNRRPAMPPVVAGNGWYEYSFDIPASYNSATNYILFQGVSSFGNDINLDDISVIVPSATPPGVPINVTATAGNASASISFSAPLTDGGSAILDYTATSSPGGFTATGATSPVTVEGLTNGTAYTFTVTARNAINSGSASTASASITPRTVPGIPVIGTAIAGNASAIVSFSAPSSNGGSPILDYTVTSSPGDFTATGASSPLTVTGLAIGTPYTFTVTARNIAGSGSASTASNSITSVPAVRIDSTSYDSINSAYRTVSDNGTILVRDITFTEALLFDRTLTFTLKGGYEDTFTNNNGISTFNGVITVAFGCVTLENITIR